MAIIISGSRDDSRAGNFCVLLNFFWALFDGLSFCRNRSIATELNGEALSTDERRVDIGIGGAAVVVVVDVVVALVVNTVAALGGAAVDRIKWIPFELFVGATISPFRSVDTLRGACGRGDDDDGCGSDGFCNV